VKSAQVSPRGRFPVPITPSKDAGLGFLFVVFLEVDVDVGMGVYGVWVRIRGWMWGNSFFPFYALLKR
jgi:hypothetical protein